MQLPLSVSAGANPYPSDERVLGSLRRRTDRSYLVGGVGLAAQLGNPKTVNVVILGFVASLLPLPWELWLATVERRVPPKYRDLNLRALELGRARAQGVATAR